MGSDTTHVAFEFPTLLAEDLQMIETDRTGERGQRCAGLGQRAQGVEDGGRVPLYCAGEARGFPFSTT